MIYNYRIRRLEYLSYIYYIYDDKSKEGENFKIGLIVALK